MSAINLTIDGQQVEVEPGTTILQAAEKLGIDIPTFCYDPDLTRNAACRMCVVEVEKARALVASCSAPVAPDMVVHTETERTRKAREIILRLILANHYLDCVTCEKTGECKLQDYCYRYGISSSDFVGATKELSLDDTNPFFVRDMNKCLLCGRCVGKCQNVNGAGAIDFTQRGFKSNVGTPFGDPIENSTCDFCGMCIEACPVGALVPKSRLGRGRPWEIEKVKTICPYCSTGCSLELHVNIESDSEEEMVIDATADEEAPVNQGRICARGSFGWDFIHNEHRLTMPLVKQDGVFVEVEWEEALEIIAEKLQELKINFGDDSLGGLVSSRLSNEEIYLFQKLLRSWGTNNVDHISHYHYSSSPHTTEALFKSGVMGSDIDDLNNADLIMVVNSHLASSHPVLNYRLREAARNGTKVIAINPEEQDDADPAHLYISPEIGADEFLLNGLINVIIAENIAQGEGAKDSAVFEDIKKAVSKNTAEQVEKVTGVSVSDIQEAARSYANAERPLILFDSANFKKGSGLKGVRAMLRLAAVAGKNSGPPAGVNFLPDFNNSQGACLMGALPNFLPSLQSIEDNKARESFSKAWATELNAQPGLTAQEMIEQAFKGTLQGMFIAGENPVVESSEQDYVVEALQNIEFLVVQDLFLTETAQHADVVLPAAAFAEKLGTYINVEGRVQLSYPALEPPEDAMPGSEILANLADYLGMDWSSFLMEDVFREMASLSSALEGMNYEQLGCVNNPVAKDSWQDILQEIDNGLAAEDEKGLKLLEDVELNFPYATGKGKGSMAFQLAEINNRAL